MLDQMVAVVVDALDRVIDFDGDDLTGVAQPDLNALIDDLSATTMRVGAHHKMRAATPTNESG
jgi:hypothetical protein